AAGYVREEPVASVGEFSLRGGILDVFSPAHDAPHRIEFFGDAVESIREFDPDTQRSIGRATESILVPMRELSVRREEFMTWSDEAERHWDDDRFRRDLRARIAHAERGEPFPGWEYLIPLTRPLTSSAFDYFKDAIVVIDEPVEIEKRASDLYRYLEDRFALADDAGELSLPPDKLFLTVEELRSRFEAATRIELRLLGRDAAATDEQFSSASFPPTSDSPAISTFSTLASRQPSPLFLFPIVPSTPDVSAISQSPKRYQGRIADLARDLETETRTTLFVMASLGLAERVTEMLAEFSSTAQLLPSLNWKQRETAALASGRIVTVGKLANGFTLPAADLSILTESDV